MELVTEKIWIQAVGKRHARWDKSPWEDGYDAEMAAKVKRLGMLNLETTTTDEIDEILGRKWRHCLCNECDQFASVGVFLGPWPKSIEDRLVWVCAACITKAYNLLPLESRTDASDCDMTSEEMDEVRAARCRTIASWKHPFRLRLKECLCGLLKMLRNG